MGRKNKYEKRYLPTSWAEVEISRIASKMEAYRDATEPGWGVVEWYSETNNFKVPVNRDKSDQSQVLLCDEDTSAVLYPRVGMEYCLMPDEKINLREAPRRSDLALIVISHVNGYCFWAEDLEDLKIFVTYDEDGLIDTYRLDNWSGKPYEGETELGFKDLSETSSGN